MMLDTNIVIYELKGMLAETLPKRDVSISVITRIELLGYPDLSDSEELAIGTLLKSFTVLPLDDTVAEQAILIRRRHRLKLPDALIVATALVNRLELLSNDLTLANIPSLKCRSVPLKPF